MAEMCRSRWFQLTLFVFSSWILVTNTMEIKMKDVQPRVHFICFIKAFAKGSVPIQSTKSLKLANTEYKEFGAL